MRYRTVLLGILATGIPLVAHDAVTATVASDARRVYMVRFADPPLALFDGANARTSGLAAPPRITANNGRRRLDVHGSAAHAYLTYLADQQASHLAQASASLGRPLTPLRVFRHALDAVVLELSAAEATKLARLGGIQAVDVERFEPLTTDIGPGFIGAASVWWNAQAGQDSLFAESFESGVPFSGDGVVVGDIDSGYNSASPSFAAQDEAGHLIGNSLGHNQYLGQCGVPGVSVAGCNDKVIGVYDEIDDGSAQHPYSVEDPYGSGYVGHGSHTASTAVGDRRGVAYVDPNPAVPPELHTYAAHIAGVAPNANLVVFRACGDETTGCSNIATAAAVDHAVADGVVDVLNYSISGGTAPWDEPTSQAFLAATAAGIFVAAAAGNSGGDYSNGRVAGSVIHIEPWTMSVAGGLHTGGPIASIYGLPSTRLPVSAVLPSALPDQLYAPSGAGPATFDVIKPEIQAPGAYILAAIANDGSPDGAALVGLEEGTSMATPHVAGAAALLMGLHPDWTPPEVKSALMMTAKEYGLTRNTLAAGVQASDPFDRGAGRVQPYVAARAGLVLDESAANFSAANPLAGGDVRTLNLASLQNSRCITVSGQTSSSTCTFTRHLRSTLNHSVSWTANISGIAGSAQPAHSVVASQQIVDLVVVADLSASPSDGNFHFGEVVLTADDGSPALHLPIAVAVPAPSLISPATLSTSVDHGATSQIVTLDLANGGGATLDIDATDLSGVAPQPRPLLDLPLKSSFPRGAYSTWFPDQGSGVFVAQAFSAGDAMTDLGRIRAQGRTSGASLATHTGAPLHFRVYPDAGGKPSSDPVADATNTIAAWHFDTTIGAPGVDVGGDAITLDLAAANAPATHLAAGTYWLVVYPEIDAGTTINGWLWEESDASQGALPVSTSAPPSTPWDTIADLSQTTWSGMALHIDQAIVCGAPWLSSQPATLTLGGLLHAPVQVMIDATKFPPGATSVVGYLCVRSTDTQQPVRAIRVSVDRL